MHHPIVSSFWSWFALMLLCCVCVLMFSNSRNMCSRQVHPICTSFGASVVAYGWSEWVSFVRPHQHGKYTNKHRHFLAKVFPTIPLRTSTNNTTQNNNIFSRVSKRKNRTRCVWTHCWAFAKFSCILTCGRGGGWLDWEKVQNKSVNVVHQHRLNMLWPLLMVVLAVIDTSGRMVLAGTLGEYYRVIAFKGGKTNIPLVGHILYNTREKKHYLYSYVVT